MSSEKRAAANRRNATKSTGPRTGAGLAKAAQNALAHGLCAARPVIPGEAAAEWDRHRAGVRAALAPVGGMEDALADRVAACLWRLRRVVAYETAVTAAGLEEAADQATLPPDDPLGDPADRSGGKQLRRAEKELAEARDLVGVWEDTTDAHERLPTLPDDAPLSGSAVEGVFNDLNGALPGAEDAYFAFDDPAFLARLGLPREAVGHPYGWNGWTAGLVRRAAAAAAAAFKAGADDLFARARDDRRELNQGQRDRVARLEADVHSLRERVAARHRRAVLRRALPDAPTLDKVTRYESHLSRQMLQALHTLERLQAARAGVPVAPPAAVDVTVDGPDRPAPPGA